MGEMKARETEYKGYIFRSQLEARWAVFFDSLGIKFRYEEETFIMSGLRYVPDFKLYGYGNSYLWAEVKGVSNFKELSAKEYDVAKVRAFSNSGHSIIFLPSVPVDINTWIETKVTTFEYVTGGNTPCVIAKDSLSDNEFRLCRTEFLPEESLELTENALQKARSYIFSY